MNQINSNFEIGNDNDVDTNDPLTAWDQAKITVFILLMVLPALLLYGTLPAMFLALGVAYLKKNSDFSGIRVSVNLAMGYLGIGLVAAVCTSFYLGSTDDPHFESSVAVVAAIIFYMVVLRTLYFSPLNRHRKWVERNGIFSSKERDSQLDSRSETRIIKGEKIRSYSVADELVKWAKLREDGVVTEQEFQEAKRKIMSSK